MTGFVAALGAWVREIIVVLFLAGTLEMLLPETDVKRFARVAMGFFIVLAVARPILALVGGGFYFDAGLASLSTWEVGGFGGGVTSQSGSPFQRGTDLQYASRDRALAAARAALEAQLTELVMREPEVADARVEADLVTDLSSQSYGHLRAVRVMVRMAEGAGAETEAAAGVGSGARTGSGAPAGTAVEPVRIAVSPIVIGQEAGGRASGDGRPGQVSGDSGSPGSLWSPGAAGGPAAVETGGAGSSGTGPEVELARRLRSVLVLILGIPPGGITVEVWR